ncbi:MAG: peptidoglycan DD-metalloendopeptidase family protein [Orrella sp.]
MTAALMVVALAASGGAQAQSSQSAQSLSEQKAQAAEQRRALQGQIQALQKKLEAQQSRYKSTADELKSIETAISDTNRQLQQLQSKQRELAASLKELESDLAAQTKALAIDKQALANQMRAQYRSGLSPWSAMLSGQDPQSLGRDLGYLAYVSEARVEIISQINRRMAELSDLRKAQLVQQKEQAATAKAVETEQQRLVKRKQQRQLLLARLDGQLAAQRAERDRLSRDEQRLGDLIEGLGQQIEQFKADQAHAEAIRDSILSDLPQGEGLKRGIEQPVAGQLLARYGSNRPDGGAWRGVLIDAETGTPVKAVAAGTVVYATWLRGFGNLIIVDHSDEFLTVYAHNESLLKAVGDQVKAGDIIAGAGNTGGQLESALYFEIRHKGVPLDPQLYFK